MNRTGFEQVVGRIATQGLLLATGPLLARATGPAGRGEAAIGVALAVLLPPLVGVGFGSAVRAESSRDHPHIRELLRSGALRSILSGLAGVAVVFIVIRSGMFDLSEGTKTALLVIAATVGISAFVDGLVSLRLLQDRQRQAVLTRVLPVGAFALYCIVMFATDRLTAVSYLYGYALLPIGRLLVIGSRGIAVRGNTSMSPAPLRSSDPPGPIPWARTGRWGIPHEISDAGLAQVALLSAGLALSSTELGLLSVGLTVSRVPGFIAAGVSDADVATIANARSTTDAFPLLAALKPLLVAVAGAAMLTAALGWILVPPIFGTDFEPSRPVLLILLLTAPMAAAINYISNYLVASGRTRESAILQLSAFAFAGALSAAAAAFFGGPVGAAIGLATAVGIVGLLAVSRAQQSPMTAKGA